MGDSTGIVEDKKGIQLANVALAEGFITADQWSEALAIQSRDFTEGKPARSLIDILVALGFLRESQIDYLKSRISTKPEPPKQADDSGRRDYDTVQPGKFGKYLVIRKLAVGPQGKVYEAYDPDTKRRLALKIIRRSHDSDPEEIAREQERFLQEGERLAALPSHPNRIRVLEAGVVRGKRYLAMDLVEGKTWRDWAAQDRSLYQSVVAIRDVSRALQQAHAHGILHGRIKPENILFDESGSVFLSDVGLGRAVRHDPRAVVTASRFSIESANYLSPEQGQNAAAVDARADVYALGVLLYELLAGEPPFRGDTPVQTLMAASTEKVRRPSAIARERGLGAVDPDLEWIALKAMARYPDDRYPTAEAFSEDLTRWLGGRRGSFFSRHRTILLAAAVTAAALAGLAGFLLLR